MNDPWQRIEEMLATVTKTPWQQSLLITVITPLIAWLAAIFVVKVLGRLAKVTASDLDDELITRIRGPVAGSIVLAGLAIAVDISFVDRFKGLTQSLLGTIAVFLWISFGLRSSSLIFSWLGERSARRESSVFQAKTIPLFDNVAKVLILSFGIYLIFLSWGQSPSALVTSAGVLTLVVGLGAKDTFANLFGGLFILADAPYKLGDFIVLDGAERGEVTKIGLRSTRILTRDDVEVTIPNALIANAKIVNESGGPWKKFRVRVKVGVAYGSDLEKVRRILLAAAKEDTRVCKDPEPRVRFRTFGASSLDLELLVWVDDPVLRGAILDALNMEVYRRFREEEIAIPFPQRDLHIKSWPASAQAAPLPTSERDNSDEVENR